MPTPKTEKTPKPKKGFIQITEDAHGQGLLQPLNVHEGLWTEGKKYRELLDQEAAAKKARENQKDKLMPIIRDNLDEFDDDEKNLSKKIWAQGGVVLRYTHTEKETLTVAFEETNKTTNEKDDESGESPDDIY